ncbi:MAG: acetylxylan esterase [Limisphaerales bacterium]
MTWWSGRFTWLVMATVSVVVAATALPGGTAYGGPARALPEGTVPDDVRLAPPKDLDGYFPMEVPATLDAWERRAERVRRQVLVSQGLWPMPVKGPLEPVIHGKRDQGDYTVEKVYFESAPGFFVTGSLYRPKGRTGRLPGVLCPHGHWENGRFMDQGEAAVRREIAAGAERFEQGGRSPLQARCVTLARMGCVVFHYDMIGYADSRQLSMALVHGFAKQRPEANDPVRWGFFSPQAEARFQSVMGLQTWNSIRALDFLEALPDVDAKRIAVTGASGGGTQTFVLCGIDPRPAVAFPAVMVSTAMQGGCTCENASGFRVGTGNIELAGLFAPKPLGLTGANDWTVDMPTKGFPELVKLYELAGAKDRVMLKHLPHFGHNYNYVSRSAMYQWMNRHLGLGLKEPVIEEDYPRLTGDDLTVWNDRHPKPRGGDDFEKDLIQWWTTDATKQLAAAAATEEGRRTVIQPAIEATLGRTLSEVGTVEWEIGSKADRDEVIEMTGLLRNKGRGEVLPATFLHPKTWSGRTVIRLTTSGKAGLFGADGEYAAEVRRHLNAGATVVGVDLMYQGEFLAGGRPLDRTPKVKNPREAAAYTFGYNPTVFQQRVHDVLTVVSFVKNHEKESKEIVLEAGPGAEGWAACAQSVSGGTVPPVAGGTGTFRFAAVRDIHSPDFVPGGAKYLDPFVLGK